MYAAEFAKLVDRHVPSRRDRPVDWLRRLPNEAFQYYERGAASFGTAAETPIERRGRLYLIHTALLFMWMSWGKRTARERFRAWTERGTRRAASLTMLEHYRRGGVVTHYETTDWFLQPVSQWTVSLSSRAVQTSKVSAPKVKAALRNTTTLSGDVQLLSALRRDGAIPQRSDLLVG